MILFQQLKPHPSAKQASGTTSQIQSQQGFSSPMIPCMHCNHIVEKAQSAVAAKISLKQLAQSEKYMKLLHSSDKQICLEVPQGTSRASTVQFLEKVQVEAILPWNCLYLYIYLVVEAHEQELTGTISTSMIIIFCSSKLPNDI